MATINDLPKIEGIRDFFRGEIYGEIGTLLEAKGVFGDRNSHLYMESIHIMSKSNELIDIVLDDKISPETKDELIEESVQNLYKKLAALKDELLH